MAHYHYQIPDDPSMTASKYLRSAYGPPYDQPYRIGSKYRARRDIEARYGDYQCLVGDIRGLSQEIEQQRARLLSPLRELPFHRNMRNSAIAFNSYHGKGNTWIDLYTPKWRSFSPNAYPFQHLPAMPRCYKFYGSIRRMDEW